MVLRHWIAGELVPVGVFFGEGRTVFGLSIEGFAYCTNTYIVLQICSSPFDVLQRSVEGTRGLLY